MVSRELHVKIFLDVFTIEEPELNITASPARVQVEFHESERVSITNHFLRPVRGNDENPQRVELGGQISQKVDRRRVCPVQVVKEQDERPQIGCCFEEEHKLTLQDF